MLTRDEMFKKYFESDIFNNKPPIKTSRSCKKIRVNHPTFERTNLDIFNIDKKAHIQRNREKRKIIPNSKSANRLKVYSKLYGSDIFNRVPCANTERPKKGGIMRAAAKNKSHCMDGVKDNNEYIKVIKKYETEHRAPEEDFKPYRYLKYEAPAERYYKNYYDLHGMVVLPESKDNKTNRADYAHNRRYLNKEIQDLNDLDADKGYPIKSARFTSYENLTNRFGKKKYNWNDQTKKDYHYINSLEYPNNNCQINRQLELSSNILNSKNKNFNENVAEINSRIDNEKHHGYYNYDVFGNPIKKNNRNLSENDRYLINGIHSKWEKTNLNWLNPETELMFYHKNENSSPFQRKINQLSDTKNIDTITGNLKTIPINNLQRPKNIDEINSGFSKKIDEMTKSIKNIDSNKKLVIKMKTSSLECEDDWDNKAKTISEFYRKNPKGVHKEKQEVTGKVNERIQVNLKKKPNNIDYHDYVLIYGTKGENNFEKYSENEIKKIFGTKGVQIYDVHKNPFDKGSYNTVNFKVRFDNKKLDEVDNQIKNIQKDLLKQNYKIDIKKEDKKFTRNDRDLVSNPGAKISILMDRDSNLKNIKLKKIPESVRLKKGFSKQFESINYGYKNEF